MKARVLFVAAVLAVLVSVAWFVFRPDPTPLPYRFLDVCLGSEAAEGVLEPHATLGSDTRIAFEARTPWRCEVPFTPAPYSVLSYATGAPDGARGVKIRVSFDARIGRTRILHEGTRAGPGDSPSWDEVKIDLASFSRSPGRIIFETDPGADPGLPFFVAEPIAFVPEKFPQGNLLLILLDTLRADRVGFNGYRRPTTPVLDALAMEGTVFTKAYSPSSWTRPSTATLLTGLEPFEHHVHTGTSRIPMDLATLASRLREAGYMTSAISRNPNVLPLYGFDRGFQKFVDAESVNWGKTTDVSSLVDLALAELERIRHQSFFLYLHINQIHAPYGPPDKYRRSVAGEEKGPSDFYDGDIRFVDAELGRLWERMRSLGLDDRTLLAVVSDHGEEFGEHGSGSHGVTLYEEVIRIPLFMRWPGKIPAAERIDRAVRLSKVMPTLLALLEIESPDQRARSLLSERAKSEASDPNLFHYVIDTSARRIHAASDGRWKYISTIRPIAKEELYDLERDPGEHRNLVSMEPAQTERLAGFLQRRMLMSRPGLRVRVVSNSDEPRQIRVKLRTDGRFTGIWTDNVEGNSGDMVRISSDENILEMVASVVNSPTYASKPALPEPEAIPIRVPDVDEIGFTLEPPDSQVEFEVLSEGSVVVPPYLRVGHRSFPLKGNFKGNDPTLAIRTVPTLQTPEGRPAVFIYSVSAGSKVEGPIPPEIQDRLRALGYVE